MKGKTKYRKGMIVVVGIIAGLLMLGNLAFADRDEDSRGSSSHSARAGRARCLYPVRIGSFHVLRLRCCTLSLPFSGNFFKMLA